ncbi:hypothetical protein BU24DRAFT_468631 [Aaosphaeria arxii CBS 175.79]|uniref:Uncharacterized protein n=1 Tax=Aaosphaeria arxii CBS 175.79 TaxID=1450172 RepID=A0A6A5X748_9PLEO|nr:uncharacterized protein BU24DRAFT_468631 [Aaosphaeria arxii CBS 175.79]KAF2008845.1 hypothetical protein BU24DRAFT_468631 [Aaosphaeria arxii CBS 175.79]
MPSLRAKATRFFKRTSTSSIRTLFTSSICTTSSSGGSSSFSSAASKIRKEDISGPVRDPPTRPARPTKRTDEVIAALMRDGTARTVLPGSSVSRAAVVGAGKEKKEKKGKGKGKAKQVVMRKRSDALVEGDYRGPRFEAGEAERLLVVGKRRDGRGRAKAMRVRRKRKEEDEDEETRGAGGRGTEWREELRVDGDGSIGRAGGVMWRSQEGMRMWVSDV